MQHESLLVLGRVDDEDAVPADDIVEHGRICDEHLLCVMFLS